MTTTVAGIVLLGALASWSPSHAADEPPVSRHHVTALRRAAEGPGSPATRLARVNRVALAIDQAHDLSASPRWRSIMAWPAADDQLAPLLDIAAPDVAVGRYPHPRGRRSPALDFRASVAAAWLTPRMSCRFPLRARFLHQRGLTPGPLALDDGRCAAFERAWGPRHIAAVELLFVAPGSRDPASTFGHVLLRLRRSVPRVGEPVAGQELVFAYAVKASPDADNYVINGLTGGYDAHLTVDRWSAVSHRYRVLEDRDVHVYALDLDPAERRDLLALLWVSRGQRTSIPYYFLHQNCATMAWDALRATLPDLPPRDDWLTHPHQVISRMVALGRARLVGTHRSRLGAAEVAESRRDDLAPKMPGGPGFDALFASRWEPDEVRAARYRALSARLASQAPLSPSVGGGLADWMDATLAIESHLADAAAGGPEPTATSPALEAAMDLRAMLPQGTVADLDAAPTTRLGPSGSRHARVALGAGRRGRGFTEIGFALVNEQPGEQRATRLLEAGRVELLKSTSRVAVDEQGARWELSRLTVIRLSKLGVGLRTGAGWFLSRLGFDLGVHAERRPTEDLPVGALIDGGPALTLAASDDFATHLVLGVRARFGSWIRSDAYAVVGAGPWVEAAWPWSPGSPGRVRVAAEVTPWASLDDVGVAGRVSGGIDVVLDRRAGVVLSAMASWRAGDLTSDDWRFSLGVGW